MLYSVYENIDSYGVATMLLFVIFIFIFYFLPSLFVCISMVIVTAATAFIVQAA